MSDRSKFVFVLPDWAGCRKRDGYHHQVIKAALYMCMQTARSTHLDDHPFVLVQ